MRQTDYESIGILSRAFISLKFRADQTGVESHFAQGFKNSIILMTIRSRRAETETHKRRVAFGWLLLESGVLYICISTYIYTSIHPSFSLSLWNHIISYDISIHVHQRQETVKMDGLDYLTACLLVYMLYDVS